MVPALLQMWLSKMLILWVRWIQTIGSFACFSWRFLAMLGILRISECSGCVVNVGCLIRFLDLIFGIHLTVRPPMGCYWWNHNSKTTFLHLGLKKQHRNESQKKKQGKQHTAPPIEGSPAFIFVSIYIHSSLSKNPRATFWAWKEFAAQAWGLETKFDVRYLRLAKTSQHEKKSQSYDKICFCAKLQNVTVLGRCGYDAVVVSDISFSLCHPRSDLRHRLGWPPCDGKVNLGATF